jgi:hypothetical protein
MKKILQCFMVALIFAACNSKTDLDTNKDVILTDTSGMYKSNIMTDTGSVIETSTLTNGNQNTAVANKLTTNTNRSTTRVTRRRGWSHAAKDATIGGVGGAVTGAIISKDKSKGAIIGGVLGAAGGYIIGRSKDKKEGRY